MDRDAIAWHRLTDVYGSAEAIPARLEALLAGERAAEDDLISRLYHQCDVSDATAAATLVLGGVLAAPARWHADRLVACLGLLALFARAALSFGCSPRAEAEGALARVLAGVGTKGRHGSLNASGAADAVWGALRRVLPDVAALLRHDDPHVIEGAAEVLALLADEAADFADAVRVTLARVDPVAQPAAGAALLCALARTTRDDDAEAVASLRAALGSPARAVRIAAAYGLLDLQGEAVGPAVIEVLVESAVADAAPRWLPDTREDDVAVQLGAQAAAYSVAVARRSSDFVQAVRCAGIALEQVCEPPVPYVKRYARGDDGSWRVEHGGPQHPSRLAVTRAQAEVLRALTEADALWSGTTDLFRRLGLPASREALRTLSERALTV